VEEIKEVLRKIEELRKNMDELIGSKGDLLDSEIIELSRLLDESLVEYYKLLKKKRD
jgi:stage 0 sporulation regulatory protein